MQIQYIYNNNKPVSKKDYGRYLSFVGSFNNLFGEEYQKFEHLLPDGQNFIRCFCGKGNYDILLCPLYSPYVIHLINRNNFKTKLFALVDNKWHAVKKLELDKNMYPVSVDGKCFIEISEEVNNDVITKIVEELEK